MMAIDHANEHTQLFAGFGFSQMHHHIHFLWRWLSAFAGDPVSWMLKLTFRKE
jgi:hypothetical protein